MRGDDGILAAIDEFRSANRAKLPDGRRFPGFRSASTGPRGWCSSAARRHPRVHPPSFPPPVEPWAARRRRDSGTGVRVDRDQIMVMTGPRSRKASARPTNSPACGSAAPWTQSNNVTPNSGEAAAARLPRGPRGTGFPFRRLRRFAPARRPRTRRISTRRTPKALGLRCVLDTEAPRRRRPGRDRPQRADGRRVRRLADPATGT
jgi:hypothetical protein